MSRAVPTLSLIFLAFISDIVSANVSYTVIPIRYVLSTKQYSATEKLLNSIGELSAALESEIGNGKPELPKLDLQTGSAVLLDMGVKGSHGYYISVLNAYRKGSDLHLHVLLLSPGEKCWQPAQTTRPLKLLYFDEKIDSLITKYVYTTAPPC